MIELKRLYTCGIEGINLILNKLKKVVTEVISTGHIQNSVSVIFKSKTSLTFLIDPDFERKK